MMILITYDVNTEDSEGKKRLRTVAKKCEDYGQRVQCSVFECLVDPEQLVTLRSQLLEIMDRKKDSLRIYNLGRNWHRRIEHHGAKVAYDPEGVLLV